ncbi:MAG TPA: glutaredoxin family protein [Candidatus Nanopelagicaceae bacterium]|nr:glutaredoxin family protein [Candidatus Nanopelagicaceae bacterium]
MKARLSALPGKIDRAFLGTCYEQGLVVVAPVKISLISRPGCHLCQVAHEIISEVIKGQDVEFEELSLLDDPDLMAKYREEIPVILINGEIHDFLRVDPDRLQSAIVAAGH